MHIRSTGHSFDIKCPSNHLNAVFARECPAKSNRRRCLHLPAKPEPSYTDRGLWLNIIQIYNMIFNFYGKLANCRRDLTLTEPSRTLWNTGPVRGPVSFIDPEATESHFASLLASMTIKLEQLMWEKTVVLTLSARNVINLQLYKILFP